MRKHIHLQLNQDVLDRYRTYYFKKYPRRKKFPIERPVHESLNKWMIMQRPQMNALKQNWKEFIVWWIKDEGYENLKLDNFSISFEVYMPTKRRSDPDNMVPKFILDGFVESGFIVDDDGTHLKKLSISTDYCKDNPWTSIMVEFD